MYVGDSIVRKTDSTLNKDEDVCTAHHGAWKRRDPTGSHRDEQHRQGRNNSDCEEI